jgi:predicted short-subunit dehydrogenase-like oxidoreductase (DUF2520 family)
MKTLNIIGAGRVGRTLAALWRRHQVMDIHDVFNRTPQSTRHAVAFIGAGRAAESLAAMRPADLWMLTTPDSELPSSAARLAASGRLRAGDVVFQCSGALPSSELRASLVADVPVASVHPLKTFADPQDAVLSFGATYCVAEGDAAALAALKPAFERIGARVSEIDPQHKTIYHAASVIVSNYLTALMETGLQCYEKAGLPRDTAAAMMAPLVRETVDNIFKRGTVKALTGPIARGDAAVVARQVQALQAFDPRIAEVYQTLGRLAVDLSRAQGGASAVSLQAIAALLQAHKPG